MKLTDYFALNHGNQSRLARALDRSPAFLWQIANGKRTCPTALAVRIERATLGVIGREDLREDWQEIWPERADAAMVAARRAARNPKLSTPVKESNTDP